MSHAVAASLGCFKEICIEISALIRDIVAGVIHWAGITVRVCNAVIINAFDLSLIPFMVHVKKMSVCIQVFELSPSTNVLAIDEQNWDNLMLHNTLNEIDGRVHIFQMIEVNHCGMVSNWAHEVHGPVAVFAIVFGEENCKVVLQELLEIIWVENIQVCRKIWPLAGTAWNLSSEIVSIVIAASFWVFDIPVFACISVGIYRFIIICAIKSAIWEWLCAFSINPCLKGVGTASGMLSCLGSFNGIIKHDHVNSFTLIDTLFISHCVSSDAIWLTSALISIARSLAISASEIWGTDCVWVTTARITNRDCLRVIWGSAPAHGFVSEISGVGVFGLSSTMGKSFRPNLVGSASLSVSFDFRVGLCSGLGLQFSFWRNLTQFRHLIGLNCPSWAHQKRDS